MIRAIEPIWQGFRYKWIRLPHRVSRLVSVILDEDDGWKHLQIGAGVRGVPAIAAATRETGVPGFLI